jgi:hypothetical protein
LSTTRILIGSRAALDARFEKVSIFEEDAVRGVHRDYQAGQPVEEAALEDVSLQELAHGLE